MRKVNTFPRRSRPHAKITKMLSPELSLFCQKFQEVIDCMGAGELLDRRRYDTSWKRN